MSRALAAVALACGVPLAALALWARLVPVAEWDSGLLATLRPSPGLHETLVRALNVFGDLWLWTIVVLAIALVFAVRRYHAAALLVVLTLAGDMIGFGLKLLVERARPEGVVIEHLLGGDSFAFPSGHVVRITALAAVLAWSLAPPRHRLAAALAIGAAAGLLMGYGRVALGVHWPSDVAGGLLLGLAWFALSVRLVWHRVAVST